MIKATILGLIFALPPLLSLVVFGTQEATGSIDPVVVFTALSFFNTLRVPFSKLPKSLRDVLDSFSAMERIQHFLLEPDLHHTLGHHDNSTTDYDSDEEETPGIVFKNVCCSYGEGEKIVLHNINLNIAPGSLLMVAGPVASGKSNLLKAILGDLTEASGTQTVSISKAYVPQVPWTNLGTVRDNILFGRQYNAAFYRKVVHACALETDFKLMTDGDQTWIGERGGNLSGGQKQRIALARAAYSRAKLYVLDSPLSAVDMYSCQHIFKYCIQDMMLSGGGTVVLATHQTELFSKSDHLVVMGDGKTIYNDKYKFSKVKHLFPGFEDADEEVSGPTTNKKTTFMEHPNSFEGTQSRRKLLTSKSFIEYENQDDDEEEEERELARREKRKAKELKAQKEAEANERSDKTGIYTWYIKKFGVFAFALAQFIFICGQIVRVYSDNWVSVWTKRKYADKTELFYILVFVGLVMWFMSLSFIRAYYYFYAGKRAANKLHDQSFGAALKAPMHFFHVTPVGKLLTFFSKDIDIIDDQLVDNML